MRIRVAVDFWGLEPEDQRHAITHEILHPLFQEMYDDVREGAHEALGGQAFRVFLAQVDRDIERLVDQLALIVGPSLPLPDFQHAIL
jgi:hypothetical protein